MTFDFGKYFLEEIQKHLSSEFTYSKAAELLKSLYELMKESGVDDVDSAKDLAQLIRREVREMLKTHTDFAEEQFAALPAELPEYFGISSGEEKAGPTAIEEGRSSAAGTKVVQANRGRLIHILALCLDNSEVEPVAGGMPSLPLHVNLILKEANFRLAEYVKKVMLSMDKGARQLPEASALEGIKVFVDIFEEADMKLREEAVVIVRQALDIEGSALNKWLDKNPSVKKPSSYDRNVAMGLTIQDAYDTGHAGNLLPMLGEMTAEDNAELLKAISDIESLRAMSMEGGEERTSTAGTAVEARIGEMADVARRAGLQVADRQKGVLRTLIVDSGMYKGDGDGEFNRDLYGWVSDGTRLPGIAEMFHVRRANVSNVDNILDHIGNSGEKNPANITVQVSGDFSPDDMKRLMEESPKGLKGERIRIVKVDTSQFGLETDALKRREYRFGLYAYMDAAGAVTKDDIAAKNEIYRTLKFFVETHLGENINDAQLDQVASEYIQALVAEDILIVIKTINRALSYKQTRKWTSPSYHTVSAAWISA